MNQLTRYAVPASIAVSARTPDEARALVQALLDEFEGFDLDDIHNARIYVADDVEVAVESVEEVYSHVYHAVLTQIEELTSS